MLMRESNNNTRDLRTATGRSMIVSSRMGWLQSEVSNYPEDGASVGECNRLTGLDAPRSSAR